MYPAISEQKSVMAPGAPLAGGGVRNANLPWAWNREDRIDQARPIDNRAGDPLVSMSYLKALNALIHKDIIRGVQLERVDPHGAELGSTGIRNSKITAKALPLLRSVNCKLESYGLDATSPETKKRRAIEYGASFLSQPKAQHIKNLAKTTHNHAKLIGASGSTTAAQGETNPSPLETGIAVATFIEYGAGIFDAINKLAHLQTREKKARIKRNELQLHLANAYIAENEHSAAPAPKKEHNHHPLQAPNPGPKTITVRPPASAQRILALACQLEPLEGEAQSKERASYALRAARYCGSISALTLQLAAIFTSGNVSANLTGASSGTATGSAALAAGLDGQSLRNTIRRARQTETFKAGLAQAIRPRDTAQNENKLTTCEAAVVSMVLNKQPGKAENTIKVASNIYTTGAYCAAVLGSAATIIALAGVGTAASIAIVATPVGWGLAGVGSALALGLLANRLRKHYLHHRQLEKLTNTITGKAANIGGLPCLSSAEDKTLGRSHQRLMDNLSDAEKLPGLSSRAAIDWIFSQLLDDAGDFIAVDPELKIVRHEAEYTFSLSNPLANEPKYRQCMEQSRMAVFLKRIIKDKPPHFIDAQIDKSMEAARVGQCAAAKRIIGELLQVKG